MTAPGSLRKCFKKVLQPVYNFKAYVIAGGATAAANKFYIKERVPRSAQIFSCRNVEGEMQHGTPI